MNLRIYFLISCAFFIGLITAQKSDVLRKDDIYIEDDLEGSGGGNREFNKDDLEASGSGYGPDDEDGPGSGDDRIDYNKPIFPVKETNLPINPESVDIRKPVDEVKKTLETEVRTPPRNEIEEEPHEKARGTGQASVPSETDNHVIMDRKHEDRATSFFAQPGILAAVIGGCVVGLLCAILVVMFIVYRMRKKDEGSYALDEPKRSPTSNSYTKNSQREFYA